MGCSDTPSGYISRDNWINISSLIHSDSYFFWGVLILWARANQTGELAILILPMLFKAIQALEGINLLQVPEGREHIFQAAGGIHLSLQRRFFIAYSLNSLTRNGVGCKAINGFWKCALPRKHIWAPYDPSAQRIRKSNTGGFD